MIAICSGRVCRRFGVLSIVAIILGGLMPTPPEACGGIFVGNNPGAQGGNDTLEKVLEEIAEYNAANEPDLPTQISLFKKSDGDAGFIFDPSSGFLFFSDAAGTMPVLTESALTDLPTAYFTYAGPAHLEYYSAKGPANFGFSLYTYMPGLNEIDLNGVGNDISHVSFWQGAPEPAGLALSVSGLAALVAAARRRRVASTHRAHFAATPRLRRG